MGHGPLGNQSANLLSFTDFNYLVGVEIAEHTEEAVGLIVLVVAGRKGVVEDAGIAMGFAAEGINLRESIVVGIVVAQHLRNEAVGERGVDPEPAACAVAPWPAQQVLQLSHFPIF
jgi:hypothetical protein